MPYELEPVSGGYYVETKATGKRHSKEPLSKETATKQMRALYAAEHNSHKSRPTKEKWIQTVVSSPSFHRGAFTKQALQHKMTARQFMNEVLSHPDNYDITTRRRAQFMANILGVSTAD